MTRLPELSIIVPAYNESKTIADVLAGLKKELDNRLVYEIIVVNDGSTDGTRQILEAIPYIKLINHKLNRGYSSSLKTGIENSRYDWILTFDSDGSHLASQIFQLLPYTDEYDLIVGSRDGKTGYDTSSRRFGRKIITAFAQYVSQHKIPDINSGFRLFKKGLAKKFWHLFPERFSFSTTITVAAHVRHYAVKYVPIEVHKRKGGSSGIKPAKDFAGFLSIVTRLAIYFNPLRVFVPLAIVCIGGSIAIVAGNYFWGNGGILKTVLAIGVLTGIQLISFGLIAEMIVKRFYND